MGLRLQRRFTLFPGVRVNLGLRGVSASFGVPGATVNLSRRGIRGTVGLLGTGLSYSANLAPRAERRGAGGTGGNRTRREEAASTPDWPGSASSWTPALAEIGSAPLERMTSRGLRELHQLLGEARQQRSDVTAAIVEQERLQGTLKNELARRRRSLFRAFFRRRVWDLERKLLPEAEREVERLRAWQAESRISLAIEGADEALRAWDHTVRAFEAVRGCAAIWDVTGAADTDRVRMRTTARRVIDRRPVRFTYGASAYIDYEGRALNLGNANGEDLLLFPGMVMVTRADGLIALIDARELTVTFRPVAMQEDETVPSDSKVVDHAWLKANKDGSPDRRFAGNRQIPVCLYGRIELRSASGLREEYLLSNPEAAMAFADALAAHVKALPREDAPNVAT